MSALFKLKSRRIFRGMKSNSLHSRASFDEHLMRWLWAYALALVGVLYLCEWVYHSTDAVPLQMTRDVRR
jgi:hypothetical protein